VSAVGNTARVTELTYRRIGATRSGRLPAGYRHLHYRTLLGTGAELYACAGEAVLTFRMHRAMGARVDAAAGRAEPGLRVTVGVGPLRVPCEIVWTVRDEVRTGWGYGTLPGHQASGEEAFVVERDDQDRVWFRVTAFSRPARWAMRLGGPLAVVFQRAYARLCGRALKRLCTVKP
jgi:uncharacterized protein (UPF0548 family)